MSPTLFYLKGIVIKCALCYDMIGPHVLPGLEHVYGYMRVLGGFRQHDGLWPGERLTRRVFC